MTLKVIQGQGQGQEMTSVAGRDYFYSLYDVLNVSIFYFCGKSVSDQMGFES